MSSRADVTISAAVRWIRAYAVLHTFAGRLPTLARVLVAIAPPLAAPGLIASGILAFVFSWNEFSIALNLTSRDTATVPVAIARFAQLWGR
jgi:ABC-type spermidine/putrescine transport system permease subunit II